MPSPHTGESHNDFMHRCMSSDEAQSDFPNDDQRVAFCESQWERRKSMNRKAYTPFELKGVDEDARTFTGLASTWDIDLDGDRIQKGAFKRTLDQWKSSNGKRSIPLIDQHNYGSGRAVIGKMVDASETDEGLETKFEVVNSGDGDEFWARIKGGYLNGLSIGFQTVNAGREEGKDSDGKHSKVRVIKEVKLMEISVVIWGANPNALIDTAGVAAGVKALKETAGERELTVEEKNDLAVIRDEINELLESTKDEQPGVAMPPEIKELEVELAEVIAMKDTAIRDEDFETAAVLKKRQDGLEARLRRKRKEAEYDAIRKPTWEADSPERLRVDAIIAGLRAGVASE